MDYSRTSGESTLYGYLISAIFMITGVFSTTLLTEGSHNRGREAHPRLELTPQKVLCLPMDITPDITKVVVSYPVNHYPLYLRAVTPILD